MGRRQTLLLMMVLLVFTSFVSAQTATITFLDEWGEATSRVLEQSKSLLRVIDPAADATPGRDSVAVSLGSANGADTALVDLIETGDATGVFEGEAFLTSDYALDNITGVDADQLYTTWIYAPDPTLDTATATYGTATDSVEVGLSESDLLDADGDAGGGAGDGGGGTVTLGGPVRIRVRDAYADQSAGPDLTTATVTTTGGDSQVVLLTETGARTRVFESSLPLGTGAPVAEDGRLQAAAGETVSVTHAEPETGTTSSSDSALVAASSVQLIRPRDGRVTGAFPTDGMIGARVVDISLNLDPAAVESMALQIHLLIGQDSETMILRETGPDTGVFEGVIQQSNGGYWYGSNSLIETDLALPQFDTLIVEHGGLSATAALTGSILRLVDGDDDGGGDGAEAETFALGADLRVELEASAYTGPALDLKTVAVRSLTTGDVEELQLLETDGRSYLFKGALPIAQGAAVPGDGQLQAQPGETVEVEHEDANGVTSSRDQAAVVRSAVRFVDEAGLPVSVLLEETTARVRVLDLPSAGQAPPTATIRSRITRDIEPLGLAELSASPGLFEGSIPMTRNAWTSGILTTGREFVVTNEPDTITAGDGLTSASLLLVPAIVEVLDGQGEPRTTASAGDVLSLRVTAPRADTAPYPQSFPVIVSSREGGGYLYVGLTETGASTGVFEGTVETVPAGEYPSYYDLDVEPSDTVEVVYSAENYPYDPTGRVVAVVAIVPLTVELLDDQGAAAASYLLGDDIHVQVVEADANANPASAETLTATVSARRYGDSKHDVETVTLTETGPDTGVFAGVLPTGVLPGAYSPPVPGDGMLEFPDYLAAPDNVSTVTATRSGVSATARMRDSELWLTDGQGQDIDSIEIGDAVQVWMRRPLGNATPGADTEFVNVDVKAGLDYRDSLYLTLTETGGDTGLFTASLPTAPPFVNTLDGIAQAMPGDLLFVQRSMYTLYSFDTAVFIGEGGGEPPNQQPNAVDDVAATNEDTAVNVAVKANDSDPDGDPLTVTSATQGANGSTAIAAGATVTYTPNPGFQGVDTFTYTVSDGNGGTDTATVTVTVSSVNHPPEAWDDLVTTDEDTAITIAVLANDTDIDGDLLTVGNLSPVTNGTLVLNPDGTVTYTPNPDFRGFENFTYTVSDPAGAQDTATVFVTIDPLNDLPTAVNDSATTNEDTALNFNVAGNDTDPDGDNLVVVAVTQGAKGSVVINQSPSLLGKYVIYTPNANANGGDSFTYTVSDGHGGTAIGTVAMTITPVNDVPDAVADSVTTPEDTPLTFNPRVNDTDADGDALTVTSVNGGTRGTPVLNADGTITYTPMPNISGTDFIQYYISDGHGGTDSALATVTTTAVNDAPNANNDLPLVTEDTPLAIAVLSNDNDPEGDTLTVTALTQPAKGTAVLNADKTITYSPNLNVTGTDSFTYTIADGNGGTDTATVNVSILPVNDPPVAVADSAALAEDGGTVTILVAANDTDPENSALTLVSVTQGAHGTVTTLTGNQVRYQPAANYFGPDTFTYTIRDPGSLTSVGTVSITVTPVNDPPVAVADSAVTSEDTPAVVAVLANDTDVDGDALTVSAVTQGANGTAATNGTTVTFTPAANWSGVSTFTYTARDAGGVERTANVTITVNPVNDPPVAGPDTGATVEGTPVTLSVLANDADIDGGALAVAAVTQGAGGTAATNGVTVTYTPGANFTGSDTFTYSVSDGQGGTSSAQVTVTVGEALGRVAILATNSAWLRSGADVLSGDVIVNKAGTGPFLNGAELSLGDSVTTPTDWDVEADSLTVAAGAVVGGDISYNGLTNNGTISGLQRSPLALPVFPALPAFLTATPGTTNINVANNGTRTLAPGSYLDLVVGRKGTVTFTGGVYHFRSITVDREAKLFFSAASEVRVQQKLSTKTLTTVGPAAGASIDASSILFYVAGINGTSGALTATPKAVDIGTSNTLSINLYAPNGTTWLQDGTAATGAFLGKDIDVGLNVQVSLDSSF